MHRNEVLAGIASDLHATETAVDAAISQAMNLVQTMIVARSTLSASAIAAAGSQAKVMETIAVLGQARDSIVAAHVEMSREHRKMGWGVYAAGPMDKPPEDGRPIEPVVTPHLRVA